jgi:F-type H+-transporting ATPase subunit a
MNTVILKATPEYIYDPIGQLGGFVDSMVSKKVPLNIWGDQITMFDAYLSVNMIGFILTTIFVGVLCYLLAKRMTLVPKGRGVNLFELIVEFVRNNIATMIHHGKRKYEPFLLTTFFFILIANFIGLLPNAKFATGTVGATFALAFVVYIYFNWTGIQAKGGWGYIKGIVPNGVPGALAPVIWVIEVLSMMLRPVSLALRLWANMYA